MNRSKLSDSRPQPSLLWTVCLLGAAAAVVGAALVTRQLIPPLILAGFAGGWILLLAPVFYEQEQRS